MPAVNAAKLPRNSGVGSGGRFDGANSTGAPGHRSYGGDEDSIHIGVSAGDAVAVVQRV